MSETWRRRGGTVKASCPQAGLTSLRNGDCPPRTRRAPRRAIRPRPDRTSSKRVRRPMSLSSLPRRAARPAAGLDPKPVLDDRHGGTPDVKRIPYSLLATAALLSLGTAVHRAGTGGSRTPAAPGRAATPSRPRPARPPATARPRRKRRTRLQAAAAEPDPGAEARGRHQGEDRGGGQGPRQPLGHGVPAGRPHARDREGRQAAHRRQGRHARSGDRRACRRSTRGARAACSTSRSSPSFAGRPADLSSAIAEPREKGNGTSVAPRQADRGERRGPPRRRQGHLPPDADL